MAVLEVAKIQVRSGLQENLPALDTGEFGWCVDTQRLFIGKGTLAEGAPMVGVTEILTEYSIGLINVGLVALEANVATLTSIVGNLTPQTLTLLNNTTANIAAITIPSTDSQIISYNITRNTAIRIGSIKVTNLAGSVASDDDYSETAVTGVTLSFGSNANAVVLGYTTTNTGDNATLTYVFQNLS